MAERLDDVRRAGLSNENLEAILGQNAARILPGLVDPPTETGSGQAFQ
jgi:hypothetical protein